MVLTIILATVLILVFLFLVLCKLPNFPRVPPGPVGLPVLGYLPFLTSNPHFKFTDVLKRRYGNVFSFWFGTRFSVVVNDWVTLKHLYVTRGKIVSGRPDLPLFRLMNNGHGLLFSEGSFRKEQNKFMTRALKLVLADHVFNIHFMKEIKRFCHELDTLLERQIKSDDVVEPEYIIQACFFNMVALMAFGQSWSFKSPEMIKLKTLIHRTFQINGRMAAILNFLPDWLGCNGICKYLFSFNFMSDTLNGIVSFVLSKIYENLTNESCENGNWKVPLNITQIYAEKIKEEDPNFENMISCLVATDLPMDILGIVNDMIFRGVILKLRNGNELLSLSSSSSDSNYVKSYQHIKDSYLVNCKTRWKTAADQQFIKFLLSGNALSGFSGFDMLVSLIDAFTGGTETSQTVFRWGIWFMAKNDDIQEKVHQELNRRVQSHLGEDGGVGWIKYDERIHLPYTQATINEIQRRACIATVGVFHSITEKLSHDNLFEFDIPKRSLVIANHWAVHHDPKYWPDPFKFDPARFLRLSRQMCEEESDLINMGQCGELVKSPNHVTCLDKTDSSLQQELHLINRASFVPFSVGPRTCWGINLAKQEIFTLFANVMLRYRFSFPSKSREYSLPQDSPDAGYMAITWSPTWRRVRVDKRTH